MVYGSLDGRNIIQPCSLFAGCHLYRVITFYQSFENLTFIFDICRDMRRKKMRKIEIV